VSQKSIATEAGVLIALSLIIAAVLEAVARILNSPINAISLAAGAISASILLGHRRDG